MVVLWLCSVPISSGCLLLVYCGWTWAAPLPILLKDFPKLTNYRYSPSQISRDIQRLQKHWKANWKKCCCCCWQIYWWCVWFFICHPNPKQRIERDFRCFCATGEEEAYRERGEAAVYNSDSPHSISSIIIRIYIYYLRLVHTTFVSSYPSPEICGFPLAPKSIS